MKYVCKYMTTNTELKSLEIVSDQINGFRIRTWDKGIICKNEIKRQS
jgi:hypothetical protein